MKTEKNNKLRGTVLFTVVAVMALLIIFLTGTLALATASSNRAHKSYSSSQASYTAKTAISSFTEAMSRNSDVVKTVMNLGVGSNASVIHPEVRIKSGSSEDKSIGLIGYWDKNGVWHDNQITVEKVDSNGQYTYDTDPNSKTYGQWVTVDLVKITATARVGKEESTVTGYIKKRPGETKTQNDNGSSGIKGFNTIGDGNFANGGRFTGGLGVGLKRSVKQDYILHNAFEADTTLTFINGNVLAGTTTFALDVHNQANRPVQETIINGNFWVQNGQNKPLVELSKEYYMTSDYTQQQIPYLYVDGVLGFSSQCTIVDREAGEHANDPAPYNIFCGTFRADRNTYTIKSADLYMMDSYDSNSTYEVTTGQDGNGNANAKENIVKGDNYFGINSGNNYLYQWVDNTLNKTDNQNKSHGGSIYCNGNLHLAHIEQLDGDVRVEGDCFIGMKNATEGYGDGGKVVIKGNLVVHGNLYIDKNCDFSAAAIYCDSEKIHIIGDSGYLSYSGTSNSDVTVKEVDNILHEPENNDNVMKIVDNRLQREYFKWDPKDHAISDGNMWLVNGEKTFERNVLYYKWKNAYEPGLKVYQKEDGSDLKYAYAYEAETFNEPGYNYIDTVDNILKPLFVKNEKTDEGEETTVVDPEDNRTDIQKKVIDDFIDLDSVRIEDQLDRLENGNPKTWYYTIPEFVEDNNGVPVLRYTSAETDKANVYYVISEKRITTDPPEEAVPYYTIKNFDGTDSGTRTDERVSYYNNSTQERITKEERDALIAASTKIGDVSKNKDNQLNNVTVYRYIKYGQPAYPESMKREAIYSAKGTPTKIVRTLTEVREEMNLDNLNASYPDNVPNETIPGQTVTYRQLCAANIAWESAKKEDCAAWAKDGETVTDTITSSCTIKGALNKDITIAPSGNETIWVVLDGVTFDDNGCNIVVDLKNGKTEESGKVCFLIKGTLNLHNRNAIVNKKIIDNAPYEFNATADWGMEFYGAVGSTVVLRNGCTITGTFRCPRTNIACNSNGKYEVKYTDEYGKNWYNKGGGQERGGDITNHKPPLIGNALFKDVITTFGGESYGHNNFGMYYTECGNGGTGSSGNNNNQTINTAEGVFELIYFSAV